MTILTINGSPKGDYSTTLHTCLYLEKKFSEVHFTYLNAGKTIKSLERDFSPAVKLFQEADILLFCYPVYTFLVPYQLHRFIELLKESGADLSGKVATQISTSKHFYDTTAHQFVKDNCSDLGLPYRCDVVNIREYPFLGGCMSCFNCATTGKCIYADGFDEFLRGTIHKHDAIIYAFRIKDHSMGSRFKMYDDRQFCNGHRTVTMGTPFGYLVAGNYAAEANLRLVIEARAQVGGNFLAGVASDDTPVDSAIDSLSATVCYAMEHQLCLPQNFLGVGGMKIFRDLIYLMRGMMRADHKFFKSHGQYDFPQKQWKKSLMIYPVGWLMGNRKLKAKMGSKMNEGMIKAYKQVVDNA